MQGSLSIMLLDSEHHPAISRAKSMFMASVGIMNPRGDVVVEPGRFSPSQQCFAKNATQDLGITPIQAKEVCKYG